MNISRRKFVKEVIKRTIPFLGIVVVGPTILSSCSKDEEPLGCNNSCTGTAQSGCGSNCSNSCVGTSANGCGGGCKTTCNDSCYDGCNDTAESSSCSDCSSN